MSRYVKLTTSNSILNIDNAPVAFTSNITTNNLNVSIETSRTISTEKLLSSNISIETNRAINAEMTLSTSIFIETNRAISSETILSSSISIETNRAITAENILSNTILLESTRGVTAKNTINNSISHIISGAASIPLLDTINEIANALNREPSIISITTNKLSFETTRAISTEIVLSNGISTQVSTFLLSDLSFNSFITTNVINRALTSEIALNININNEITRALTSEASLSSSISNFVSNTTTLTSNNISLEVIRAISDENRLSTVISITNNNFSGVNTNNNIDLSGIPRFSNSYPAVNGNVKQIGYTFSPNVLVLNNSTAYKDQNNSTTNNLGFFTLPEVGSWFISGQAVFFSPGRIDYTALCIGNANTTLPWINTQSPYNTNGDYVYNNWEGLIGFQQLSSSFPDNTNGNNIHFSKPLSGIIECTDKNKIYYVNTSFTADAAVTVNFKFNAVRIL